MKIVVFGASGRTGGLFVEEALALGHEVIAYVRSKESIQCVHPNVKIVEGQLNERDKLRTVITGADACISTLGGTSLTKHSYEITEGIHQIISIMEEVKVKRFIYMSSMGVGNSRNYMPQPIRFFITNFMLRVPLADHQKNENCITKSQLEWTILRPGGLTDGAKSDALQHGTENIKLKGNPSISRSTVASFILNQLSHTQYVNQCVWLFE